MLGENALVFQKLRVVDKYVDTEKGNALKEQVHTIKVLMREAVDSFKRNSIKVGRMLINLEESKLYLHAYVFEVSTYHSYSDAWIKEPFIEFCQRQFGISKSTVYALQDVARRFGDESGEILPDYQSYSYSQLVELLPLTEEEIKSKFNPSMTVKQIQKEKKKSEKEKNKSEIVAAEEVEEASSGEYVFDDIKQAKEDFKKFCKYFFELKKASVSTYEDNTYRSYKGSGFGELLFEYLKEHKFFDKQG